MPCRTHRARSRWWASRPRTVSSTQPVSRPLRASRRDVLGPIAKTITDAALAYDVLSGYGTPKFKGEAPTGGYSALLGKVRAAAQRLRMSRHMLIQKQYLNLHIWQSSAQGQHDRAMQLASRGTECRPCSCAPRTCSCKRHGAAARNAS